MNAPDETSDDAIDQLVKRHVEREIAHVDTTGLVARVRATRRHPATADKWWRMRPSTTHAPATRRWSRSISWVAMTACAVGIAFAGGRYLDPSSANAAVVLRGVQFEHARPVDHCYRVQFAPDPRFWDGKNKLEGPSMSVLWTRGDRFWSDCRIGDIQLTLGRDVDGTLWVSTSPSKGIQFTNDASELPKAVALVCDVNSMSVPQLVEDVLADFDLHVDPAADRSQRMTLVWARLKLGRTHPLLSDALLEIDPQTNVVNRLVLWTVRNGHPSGTITYTMLESTPQSDDRYSLQSHLDADAEIEVHTLPAADDETAFEQ